MVVKWHAQQTILWKQCFLTEYSCEETPSKLVIGKCNHRKEVADAKFEAMVERKRHKIAGKSDTISKAKSRCSSDCIERWIRLKNRLVWMHLRQKGRWAKALLAAAECLQIIPAPVVKNSWSRSCCFEENCCLLVENSYRWGVSSWKLLRWGTVADAVRAVVAETSCCRRSCSL